MGVKIFDLVEKKEIKLQELINKIIVIDGNLHLYQFLSSIRQSDGTPLMDSKGNITSHLNGLFYRSIKLMENKIKLCYVFDGKSPDLKLKERERRYNIKKEAIKKLEEAEINEDLDEMKKYSQMTSKLSKEMIEEAKELLIALGIPVIQAPSEGEAQASYMVKKGDAYAVASQDADSLLFGASRLIKNVTINPYRKLPGRSSYSVINPELIELNTVLSHLNITYDQLIVLGILVGTDFNVGGVKGIGPKKALKLVKQYDDFDQLFNNIKWDFPYSWRDVFNIFKNIECTDNYELKWRNINKEKVFNILCERHDFSKDRVENALVRIKKNEQTTLNKWF